MQISLWGVLVVYSVLLLYIKYWYLLIVCFSYSLSYCNFFDFWFLIFRSDEDFLKKRYEHMGDYEDEYDTLDEDGFGISRAQFIPIDHDFTPT